MAIPPEISVLIQSSGNSFHAKVARWFQAHGWHTQISPYYMDQTQDKARELDLVAEKVWPIHAHFNQRYGDVVVRLFIECKFVGADAVFWFTPKNMQQAKNLVCRTLPFRSDNLYTDKHHYLTGKQRVAKLFATAGTKGTDSDPFFKALNQALNATLAMRALSATHPSLADRRGTRLVKLSYPVVVCSSFGRMYATDFFGDAEPEVIGDNFLMEVEYAYFDQGGNPRNELFLLDFVDFAKLEQFENAIEEEVRAAAYLASTG